MAQAIQTVEAEGVTYVTAAGNDASNAYQAAWSPISGTFDGTRLTDAESFGGSLVQTVTVNTEGTGYEIPLLLEWNQAYGQATSDLEILVFNSSGRLVGTATNQSDAEPTNPWVEYDFTRSGTYYVAIENLSGPNPGLIKEITEGDGLPAAISGANVGSVYGHAMTPGAITAGAVSVADTPAFGVSPAQSESFSSSGAGTELLFANNGTPLSSPEVLSPVVASGVDDIHTTVSGNLSDFYGTSAASASLAGVAALLLSADPNLTPAQVEQVVEQTALPMGNSAVSGAGLVQVDPAVEDVLLPPAVETPIQSAVSMTAGEVLSGSSLFNAASAPNGATITEYWVTAGNPSVGQWDLNGQPVSGAVTPAQLSELTFDALTPGSETIYLQATDNGGATWSAWQGNGVAVTVAQSPPVVETPIQSAVSMTAGEVLSGSSLFNAASAPNGATITEYWVTAGNPSVGQWDLNGQPVSGAVTPAQLSELTFDALTPGRETIYLQATDNGGATWSAWQGNGVAVTVAQSPPVVETPIQSAVSMTAGEVLSGSSLFNAASAPNGATITGYWVTAGNPSVGQWDLNGQTGERSCHTGTAFGTDIRRAHSRQRNHLSTGHRQRRRDLVRLAGQWRRCHGRAVASCGGDTDTIRRVDDGRRGPERVEPVQRRQRSQRRYDH